jgi:hypothetical protein
MSKRKKVEIKYSKERVVLSDILPFETPVTFSNRHFYRFLEKNIQLITNDTEIDSLSKAVNLNPKYSTTYKRQCIDELETIKSIKNLLFYSYGKHGLISKPFCYKIRHKETDFRELSIIHPKNQVEVVNFYDKYKDLIIYYSSISPYSIRKPVKVAKYVFYNDKLHQQKNDVTSSVGNSEQYDTEYENLKSFFAVKKYNNIHKFFESYQFHRSEKKYNNLYRFDISKCFDSIYTHTIVWALLNREIVKDNIPESLTSFGGEFDILMQKLNFNETNGIVIGPEFSRIFAELILQQIDKNVHQALIDKKDSKDCLIHKRDYEIFRYVDDYFIFYNQESTKDEILNEFKHRLKEYKLSFNDSKSELYYKPIITPITIAKQKISDLFKEHLKLKEKTVPATISEKIIAEEAEEQEEKEAIVHDKTVYFSSNHVITRFKIIIKETGVEYKDIMNFTLAALDNNVAKLIKKYPKFEDDKKKEKTFVHAFLQVLDVAFFLYSVSPRVNSTMRICMACQKIIEFSNTKNKKTGTEPFDISNKHLILKKIYDEIILILHKYKSSKFIQVETLYLLICLSELGREYRLTTLDLCNYFGIEKCKTPANFEFKHNLNYFSITVLLFYIKNIKQYECLKEPIKALIISKFDLSTKENWRNDTELMLLLFDSLTCPYLDSPYRNRTDYKKFKAAITLPDKLKYKKRYLDVKYDFKKKLLSLNEVTLNHISIIESQKFWFTKWTGFNFGMELEAKKSLEVYS